jgi:NADP-dependent 3-hydroxy acid dehydrogenase YdfG
MQTSLKGKWVLITGASSGFGAAAARAFGAENARLLLGARRMDRLKAAASEAMKAGAEEVHVHSLDVSKTASVNKFVEWSKARLADGPESSLPNSRMIDVLINNAGGALGIDYVAQGKDEDWEAMMESNVLGLLRVTRATLPLMMENPGSSILNIGSNASRISYEGGAAYCAAKAGELAISHALRLELCGTGIRVCSIDPGLAKTEFSLVRFKGDAERAEKPYEGTFPLLAEDIAEILVWVASRPPHVNIDELLVKPTDQAAIYKLHRRKG